MTSEEYEAIKSKYDILSNASMKIGQAMYQQNTDASGANQSSDNPSSEDKEKVVDAEYEDLDKK